MVPYPLTLRRLTRFCRKTEVMESGCWQYVGPFSKGGYGTIGAGRLAHRVLYAWLVGDVPAGLELDHTCNNTRCVNPRHLEPVTTLENRRRAVARRTHCKYGHPRTSENFRAETSVCVPCAQNRTAAYYAKHITRIRARAAARYAEKRSA